tara:strand:- start:400 stop:834 length:435 start_codon:yes stop_codon:yes gene_type:complete
MAVTKLTKPVRDYHVWDQSEVTTSGQVVGVEDSLGRTAAHVSITTSGQDTIVQFNTVQKVYQSHASVSGEVRPGTAGGGFPNAAMLGPDAAFYRSPVMLDDVDAWQSQDAVTIPDGQTWVWDNELRVHDIRFLQIGTTMTLTVS